jgi:hypothetical protein
METYLKIYNIQNHICHSVNPNIRVFYNGSWIQNSTTGAYYGAPISDVVTPGLSQSYNPYKSIRNLSYKDILIIYKRLARFQKFVKYLCLKCKSPVSAFIDKYIDMADDWMILEGNFLFPFSYYLVSQNIDFYTNQVRPINYYPTSGMTPFIEKVMNKYGGLDTVIWKNDPRDSNDKRVDIFMQSYINKPGKIGKLIDAVYQYKKSSVNEFSSSCDVDSALQEQISNDIRKMAFEFYNLNHSCKPVQTSNPGSSPTNKANFKMNILLTNNIDDLGIFFVPAQMWKCGKVYQPGDCVLMNGGVFTPSSTFAGWYNEKANKIYFDECELDENGFPTGELKMNGADYTNFKCTVRDTSAAVTLQARWDSQLAGLRAYRKGATNWFDEDGYYKVGVKFHEEAIDESGSMKYESYITSIQQSSPEVGHDVITYTYIIDQLSTSPYPQTGVQFKDEYHRYKVGTGNFYYDFVQKSYVTYQPKTLGNYSNVYKGSNGIFPYGDPDRFDYFPLSKIDYYEGLAFEPTVSRDVNINRQINRAFEHHMALAECRTFYQVMNYRNGGFFKIKDLTETDNKNEITQRS